MISIHAAREGGDRDPRYIKQPDCRFQSTPPVKAATANFVPPVMASIFQSTPPVKAATFQAVQTDEPRRDFNPRRP